MSDASAFLADVLARASATPRTIVFPESQDFRTVEAVTVLARRGIVRPVLVRRSDATTGVLPGGGVQTVDPLSDPAIEKLRFVHQAIEDHTSSD